jgi:hypothetical protein
MMITQTYPAIDPIKTINTDTDEVLALIGLIRVLARLEERDFDGGENAYTIADAASGLAVLADDIRDRVHAIRDKTNKLVSIKAVA